MGARRRLGRGQLKERRYITAADLDKAAPDHPVYLTHTTGHYAVANSLALKLAGVTRETKDPAGGTIERDNDGNPTGVMKGTQVHHPDTPIEDPAADPS